MCNNTDKQQNQKLPPPSTKDEKPSFLARYTCVGILLSFFAIWAKYTFVPESATPGVDVPMHSYLVPLSLTAFYLVSLPLLRIFTEKYLSHVDVKFLLKESMVVYNVTQVALNGWMVYRFLEAVIFKGHPFIGDVTTLHSGTSYAIWVHYCDKYLEFFDTYFMVLRGKMNQVSFLHVYHHTTIAWAWFAAMNMIPGGDSYFGALFNSWIHVMMYSYYALSLLKVHCPWKKYLTQAQLIQFLSVNVYTAFAIYYWPKETVNWGHYVGCAIQIGEMTSLFVLFSQFYKKSYKKKKTVSVAEKTNVSPSGTKEQAAPSTSDGKEEDDHDDQCQVAVATTTETISKALNAASKDANKIMQTAKKVAPSHMKQEVDAMSRPSWSIIN